MYTIDVLKGKCMSGIYLDPCHILNPTILLILRQTQTQKTINYIINPIYISKDMIHK